MDTNAVWVDARQMMTTRTSDTQTQTSSQDTRRLWGLHDPYVKGGGARPRKLLGSPPNEHTSEGGRDDRGVPYHAESTLSSAQVLKVGSAGTPTVAERKKPLPFVCLFLTQIGTLRGVDPVGTHLARLLVDVVGVARATPPPWRSALWGEARGEAGAPGRGHRAPRRNAETGPRRSQSLILPTSRSNPV